MEITTAGNLASVESVKTNSETHLSESFHMKNSVFNRSWTLA